jgi:hypothetical protein
MCRVNQKMYDINMMDGNAFLTWLQKLGRVSEDILLGRLDEQTLTLDHLNFSEPPNPSSIAPSRGASSSPTGGGLSLPRIKSIRETAPPQSPSSEIIASARSVSRGVGTDDRLSPSLLSRGFSPPRTTGSLFTTSVTSSLHGGDESDDFNDPYKPYMSNHTGLAPGVKRRHQPTHGALSPMNDLSLYSSSSSSPLPLQLQDQLTGNESIMSAVTDSSSMMFSPIHPAHLSSSSRTQPMVASLLGTNPWSEIDQERRRGRGRRRQDHSKSAVKSE